MSSAPSETELKLMMPGTNFPTFIQLCLKNDIWVTSVRMILLAFQTPWLR
jgi:hypothetical protein